MQIVPMRDLKNTVEIEKKCDETNEPVFVTKNGYGRLVVMNVECYERMVGKVSEARLVNKGISDYETGKVVDGKTALRDLRGKYGL